MATVASTIRYFRSELQMSQIELAYKAGLDRTYISGVERGVRNITVDTLELIVYALGVNIKVFFSRVADEMDSIHGLNEDS